MKQTRRATEVLEAVQDISISTKIDDFLTSNGDPNQLNFEANQSEIDKFVSSIDINNIENERDSEIIGQLIEYINSYKNDIVNQQQLYDALDTKYDQIEHDFWELKEELFRLRSVDKLRQSMVRRQNQDLEKLSTTLKVTSQKNLTTLGTIHSTEFDENGSPIGSMSISPTRGTPDTATNMLIEKD